MRRIVLVAFALTIGASSAWADAVTIDITAQQFSFSPSTFTVNQGDVVTINVTVSSSDGSSAGHGLLMETYVEPGINVPRGTTKTVTFTATTPGTFAFVCTRPTCGAGHSNMFGQMVVNAASSPSISTIDPPSASTAGGTPIVITGTGFRSGAGVAFGGVPAPDVVVDSSTSITALTPLGPANEEAGLPRDVTVTNPDGTTATLSRAFTWFVPPLSILSVAPSSGLAGGGTVVTITGTGFTTAVNTSVKFGDVPATGVRVVDAVTLQATAPAHAPGSVDVAVAMGSSTAVASGAFHYAAVIPRRRAARHSSARPVRPAARSSPAWQVPAE